jgi:NADH:ubiquinone oxidoreductase subunit C
MPGTDMEQGSEPSETEQVDLIHGVPLTTSHGQQVLHPTRDRWVEVVKALHDDGFHSCIDLTAVDRLRSPASDLPDGVAPERFEVVATLRDHGGRRRIRLRAQVPEQDTTMPSLFALHPGVDAFEREVFDLFGIEFSGHPDMTRILLPEDWIGHPLRKDQGSGRIPVQFKVATERPR